MKIFLPQFVYSHPTYTRPSSSIKNQINPQIISKTSPNHNLLSFTNRSRKHYNFSKRSKSMMKTSNEEDFSKQILEEPKKDSFEKFQRLQKNKSQVLTKLNNIYSKQKIYCMDFNELAIEMRPDLEQLKKCKNNREQLIHFRKNTKNITKNLAEMRKNSQTDKRVRVNNQTEDQMSNKFFIMTKQIAGLSSRKTESNKKKNIKLRENQKSLNLMRRNSTFRPTKNSQTRKAEHPDCSPWSPSKIDHEIDFFFS